MTNNKRKVRVQGIEQYRRVRGLYPTGRARWLFQFGSDAAEGREVLFYDGHFRDAKAAAVAHARRRGIYYVRLIA